MTMNSWWWLFSRVSVENWVDLINSLDINEFEMKIWLHYVTICDQWLWQIVSVRPTIIAPAFHDSYFLRISGFCSLFFPLVSIRVWGLSSKGSKHSCKTVYAGVIITHIHTCTCQYEPGLAAEDDITAAVLHLSEWNLYEMQEEANP